MLSQDALPENLLARCLDVLRKLSANERDLIRVVVEVVHDLRDPSDNDDEDLIVRVVSQIHLDVHKPILIQFSFHRRMLMPRLASERPPQA